MEQQMFANDIPDNSILGINYSGMHDSAIAIVAPTGEPVFAVSLERISRVKQDGRYPTLLLENLPWQKISSVAFSVESKYREAESFDSDYLDVLLEKADRGDRSHQAAFFEFLQRIDKPKVFISHHLSHAASAFWPSQFERALCLVYDGGMANEDWFGGVYLADRSSGINCKDLFAAKKYANVAYLYSAVTAILGFSPLKHEGKITGLAAYGKENKACLTQLNKYLADPLLLDGLSYWQDMYSEEVPPVLTANVNKVALLRQQLKSFSREDLAFNVQKIAEDHILAILRQLQQQYPDYQNVCLSGGLFANVKINQRISELGFNSVFVSPPMSDDGTALGAALQHASANDVFAPQPMKNTFLGPVSSKETIDALLEQKNVSLYQVPNDRSVAEEIAQLLADDKIVAIYQGASEFGPRALGNRSILASASDADINRRLNNRLHRTEFMPFAPMCLAEDASDLFDEIDKNYHTAQFMTITANCKPIMKQRCPAVVHCDGTARPQLVVKEVHPLIHAVISKYKQLADRPAVVNTSFNVHEEPIVCTAEDALKSFFESGLDYLYLGGVLIALEENRNVESEYLREKLVQQASALKSSKAKTAAATELYSETAFDRAVLRELTEKQAGDLEVVADERDQWHQKFASKSAEYVRCIDSLEQAKAAIEEAEQSAIRAATDSERQRVAMATELAGRNAELDQLRVYNDAILSSLSWRVLAPVRAVANLFKADK